MIYQQQTVAADAPVMREMAADAHGSSSSYFCAAVAAMAVAGEADAVAEATAAASSGSYCLCASVVAMADVDSAADSANHSLHSFAHTKRCQVFVPDTSLLLCKKHTPILNAALVLCFAYSLLPHMATLPACYSTPGTPDQFHILSSHL